MDKPLAVIELELKGGKIRIPLEDVEELLEQLHDSDADELAEIVRLLRERGL